MSSRSAKTVVPPAMLMAFMTSTGPFMMYSPGRLTLPTTLTLLPSTFITETVTTGSGM